MATQADYNARPSRRSFAERAAENPDLYYDDIPYDDGPYKAAQPGANKKGASGTQQRQNTSAHRTREPQAALHVPKPRNYIPDSDSEGPDQALRGLSRKPDRPTGNIPSDSKYQTSSNPRGNTPTGNTPAQRVRKSSLPDRSPLQRLEGRFDGLTKEEKRARMQNAELASSQRRPRNDDPSITQAQRDDRRYVSDGRGTRSRPQHDGQDRHYRRHATDPNRHSQGYGEDPGLPIRQSRTDPRAGVNRQSLAEDGRKRFSQASEALRAHSDPSSQEDIEDLDHDDELYRRNSKHVSRRNNSTEANNQPSENRSDGVARSGQRRELYDKQEAPPRSNSKRLQKKDQRRDQVTTAQTGNLPEVHQQLHSERTGPGSSAEPAYQDPDVDVLPMDEVKNSNAHGPTYRIPPQTTTAMAAKARVDPGVIGNGAQISPGGYTQSPRSQKRQSLPSRALDEWRNAGVAKLELDDLALDDAIVGRRGSNRKETRSRNSGNYEGPSGEYSQGYQPSLLVRCGPLLRYTGLRRERRNRRSDGATVEREIWRGSIMIVTDDKHSSYSAPTLKLFAQPMELLPSLPHDMRDDLPSDYVDPVAGQIKASPMGRPTFVKPIESIPEGVDLSQKDVDDGIFESYRSSANKWRIKMKNGERLGKFREVKGARLHSERGLTFWRFNIEVELGISQARIAYRINNGPATGFWVPARGQTMNIMFHSCNGFSLSVNPDDFSGPDPLWRDVLNSHNMKPYHVMIGGGDQIYNDRVTVQTQLFKEWLAIKNPEHKHHADFTREMQDELESFYLHRYAMWFSQGLFGMANGQIPMVNLWDDHDIIDGYGSYPDHFMKTKVFTGLGAVAFKYYMLFQHQSLSAETFHDEPSWVMGASPGPYIHQHSRSIFMFLGRKVAFLGLDCRTERRRDEILCQETYDQVFNRCRAEIIKGETKHLIVLLTVPIAYPRLNFLENVLTSRVMDPIKAIGRTGALGGFVNKFDGGVEILDDLDDHWTAKHHKQERNWFVQELQALAAEKSVRVTILGGDVHLGAVGQFFTPRKFGIPKDQDHRYMPNVVSSAIVNTPPPVVMSDVLNRRNKLHHLDDETDEDMIQMFGQDVDGKPRKNKTLLPRRNYCTIREYVPGSTPPHSPSEAGTESPPEQLKPADDDRRRYPPGSMGQARPGMGRSRSLTREDFRPRNLIRRLSGSRTRFSFKPDQGMTYEEEERQRQRSSSAGPARGPREESDSYFPPDATDANTRANSNPNSLRGESRPTNVFRRRPTDMADKRISNRRDDAEDRSDDGDEDPHAINLEGGLDICLNMEISQHDPAGITMPYRLLVPALFYYGPQDANTTRFKTRRASFMERIRGRSFRGQRRGSDGSSNGSGTAGSRSPSPGRQDHLTSGPHRAVSQPIHPDDKLQFADQFPSQQPSGKDHRRDSSIAGVGGLDEQQQQHQYGRRSQDQPVPNAQRARKDAPPHATNAGMGQEYQPTSHAGTAPLPPDEDDEEMSEDEDRPPRRLGFLGSIRRRFSRNRYGRRGDGDEYASDDLESYDSQSGDEDDYRPATRPPPTSNRPGGGGPRYRHADEAIYRNDGRLPSGGTGRFGNMTSVTAAANSAQRAPSGRQGNVAPAAGRTSIDRRPLPAGHQAVRSGQAAAAGRNMRPDEGMDDGGSMTFSDLESLEGQKRTRRPSKAERFFGTGEPEQQSSRPPQQQQQQQQPQNRRRPSGGYGGHNGYEDSEATEEMEDDRPRRSWQFWKRRGAEEY